jgi:hypothetical protein
VQQRASGSGVELADTGSAVTRRRLSAVLPALGSLILAALVPLQCWAQLPRDCGSRRATFDYGGPVDGTSYPSLSSHQQASFEKTFCDQVTVLEQFFGPAPQGKDWWQPAADQPMRFLGRPDTYLALRGTFDGPFPDLRVLVSDEYTISEALVPASLGHRGLMQFPAYEAALNEAAITHELVHVFFPNGNRLLAEGLAVYIQSLINPNPAFPNFGKPLEQMVNATACRLGLGDLSGIDLVAQLDRVSTPRALLFRVGQQFHNGALDTYPVAGSFVKFLIEKRGWDLFHTLYLQTPLVPFERDEGTGGRWELVYNVDLRELERAWKSQFAGAKCSAN